MPGNRAISYSRKIPYGLYEVESVEDDSLAVVGEKLLLADALAAGTASAAKDRFKAPRRC